MKKKTLLLGLLIYLFTIQSCKKEEEVIEKSSFKTEYEGKYFREVTVSDASGDNSVYLIVSSDNECKLDAYVASTNFNIEIGEENPNLEIIKKSAEATTPSDSNLQYYSLDKEPDIFVTRVSANLKPEITSYSLKINQNITKAAEACEQFLFGAIVGYSGDNWDQFLGISSNGWGYDNYIKMNYKSKVYNLSWTQFGPDYNLGCAYTFLVMNFTSYKKSIVVYQHYYQENINYRIAYSAQTFRGHDCSIGSYDGANCYIGTPPVGTTAFMYPNNTGAFYYSPMPTGTKCPYPGSGFDGANCYVMDIPTSNPGFIYGNKWYVQPDLIYN